MILLNTTFCVDSDVRLAFVDFLIKNYIPAALNAGMAAPVLSSLMAEPQLNILTGKKSGSIALQIQAQDEITADQWRKNILPPLLAEINHRWGVAVSLFDTSLKILGKQ